MSRTESTMIALGTPLPKFELTCVLSGKVVKGMEELRGKQGLLVMFVCAHCPYVKHVEAELAKIADQYYGTDGTGPIGIVAIQSNDIKAYPQDGPDGMREQAERLGWHFPYLLDETQEVAKSFDAACTPDFFLYDAKGVLAYRGQMDGSRPRRGDAGNSVPVTGEDLRAAIDAVIAGRAPAGDQRTSLGCNIKWKGSPDA